MTIRSEEFWSLPGLRGLWGKGTAQDKREFVKLLTLSGYFDLWERTFGTIYDAWLRSRNLPPTFEDSLPVDFFFGTWAQKFNPCTVPVVNQNVVNEFLLKFHPELMGIETVVSESDLRNRDRGPDDVGESEKDKGARLDGVRRRGVGGFPDTVEPQLKNVDEYGRIAGPTQRFEGEDGDDFFDDPFNQEPTLGSKLRISDEGVVIDFGENNAVIFGGIAIAALLLYSLAK